MSRWLFLFVIIRQRDSWRLVIVPQMQAYFFFQTNYTCKGHCQIFFSPAFHLRNEISDFTDLKQSGVEYYTLSLSFVRAMKPVASFFLPPPSI